MREDQENLAEDEIDEEAERKKLQEQYKKKNLVIGIDEDEEMRLAIIASIESQKHELSKQLDIEDEEEEKRMWGPLLLTYIFICSIIHNWVFLLSAL